jgi:hypothetical protein
VGKGKLLFRQTDVQRLIQGARAAGLTPKAIRVNSQGELKLELGAPEVGEAPAPADEWKVWGDQ